MMGTSFLTQGSNKRSITLDLKQEAGREILKKLVAGADVLVENYRPGAFEALGLGYEALLAINPRLIYCSISAFGQDGVRREQTAYDHVIQATSGIMASTGTEEVNPIKIGAPAVDYATGTMGAFALASALFQRERTGKGQHIDLAMLGVAMMLQASLMTGYFRNGTEPKPHGNKQPFATNSAYDAKEGMVMIGASNIRQQARFWRAVERAGHDQDRQRGADRRPRARSGDHRRHHQDQNRRRVGGLFPGAARARRAGAHDGRGARRSAFRGAPRVSQIRLDAGHRRPGRRAAGGVQIRAWRPLDRASAARDGRRYRGGAGELGYEIAFPRRASDRRYPRSPRSQEM
jgi:crotonobetainyl-CoA:carnitine CoA-transferase CaiB-like acyl-CoA transferase